MARLAHTLGQDQRLQNGTRAKPLIETRAGRRRTGPSIFYRDRDATRGKSRPRAFARAAAATITMRWPSEARRDCR